jgi:hypothetical protein
VIALVISAKAGAATGQRTMTVRARGRPFPGGFSGNIHGGAVARKRADELYRELSADYPSLSATGAALLRQACRLMVRSATTKSAEAAAKCASEARQAIAILKMETEQRKPSTPKLTMRERLAAELERQAP